MTTSTKDPKTIRRAAGWSVDKAAVVAGVSSVTARIYEADRNAVSEKSRELLDPVYNDLASRVEP